MRHAVILSVPLLVLLAAPAPGQIDVPAQVRPGEPIIAVLNAAIPDGAQLDADSGWTIPDNVGRHFFDDQTVALWPPKAGTYALGYDGFWIHTQSISVIGADGQPVTINSYLGHGRIRHATRFRLLRGSDGDDGDDGDGDDDDDQPTPGPVTRLGVMIIEHAELRTSLPYGQVQSMTLPDIREIPSVFRLVDKDNPAANLAPWLALAKSYPWLILHDVPTSRVVWQGPVPGTAPEMRALLTKHQPRSAVERALRQTADPRATVTPARQAPAAQSRPQTIFGRLRR